MDGTVWTESLDIVAAALVGRALSEDLGTIGDITTRAVVDPGAPGSASIIAREAGIVAGLPAVSHVFEALGDEVVVDTRVSDGDAVEPDEVLVRINGTAHSILGGERTALNFLGHLSGIATLAARFVARLEGTGCKLLDTRKTTPGLRALEKYAVACGGGTNHRHGLYDMVLLKENHIVAAGGFEAAVTRARFAAQAAGCAVEVEVRSIEEFEEVLPLGVDRVMLDNFDLGDLASAVEMGGGRVELEASGGVDLERVRDIGRTGVDWVSVGGLTHSAPALDLSLLFES